MAQLESEDYESLEYIYRNEEEVKTMLVTALAREREQIFQNGLREGEQKGKQEGLREGEQKGKQEGLREGEQKGKQEGLREGEQKGRIETAKAMLARGMEISLISEITDLPEAQLLQLKEELSSVKN